jgi:hypothetical protein
LNYLAIALSSKIFSWNPALPLERITGLDLESELCKINVRLAAAAGDARFNKTGARG